MASRIELTPQTSSELAEVPDELSSRPQTIGFLSLPAEIRLQIYSHLMKQNRRPLVASPSGTKHQNIEHGWEGLDAIRSATWRRPLSHSFSPKLFQTCHQVHDEATHYFYSRVTRLLHVDGGCCPPAPIWPHESWSYRQLGWVTIEIFLELPRDSPRDDGVDDVSQEWLGEDVADYCAQLTDSKLKSLVIHYANFTQSEGSGHFCLEPLAMLVSRVEEVVVGYLRDWEGKRDTAAYHAIKDVLRGVPKWKFPYKDEQYAD